MSDLWVIALGAILGGFVNGLAGFGTGLFALGLWLSVLPPEQAVAMTVATAVATGLQGLWIVRGSIMASRAQIARFLLPACMTLPLGAMLLDVVDPRALQLLIAALMIAYGAFFILRGRLPKVTRPMPVLDVGFGLASGVLGGLAGLSGGLMVLWVGLRPWTKSQTRAVLQPFNFAMLSVMLVVFTWRGVYDAALLPKLALALACALVAAQVGVMTFRRLSDIGFRWLIIGLMTLSGCALLLRSI